MYPSLYRDMIEDDPFERRLREREALLRAVSVMKIAQVAGLQSMEAVTAIFKMRQLWSILIDDVVRPECELPMELKARLISIGLWVFRELEDLRSGKSKSFDGLIEVTQTIADGLR